MSIVASELVWRKSVNFDVNTGSGGGRMSATSIPTGVKNNIFPDVPQSERVSGSTTYRKIFIHVANDASLTLVAPKIFVESRTPGDDLVDFLEGTQTDTQSQLNGTEQHYGSGKLHADVSIGGQSIEVETEDSSVSANRIFVTGMKVRITDKASINGSGNEEYLVITGTPTYNGNLCTFSTTTGLVHDYLASNSSSKVSSVYEPGDVSCVISGWTESGNGTYNEADYPVQGHNIGTVDDDWTLTFSGTVGQDSTTFTVAGVASGSVGSGNTGSPFTPANPNFSKPYFTLLAGGWNGTWKGGNTIQFHTAPAAIPLWYVRKVPENANSLSGNSVVVAVDGESS